MATTAIQAAVDCAFFCQVHATQLAMLDLVLGNHNLEDASPEQLQLQLKGR